MEPHRLAPNPSLSASGAEQSLTGWENSWRRGPAAGKCPVGLERGHECASAVAKFLVGWGGGSEERVTQGHQSPGGTAATLQPTACASDSLPAWNLK